MEFASLLRRQRLDKKQRDVAKCLEALQTGCESALLRRLQKARALASHKAWHYELAAQFRSLRVFNEDTEEAAEKAYSSKQV